MNRTTCSTAGCDRILARWNKSGICTQCARTGYVCKGEGCDRQLGQQNRSGMCRPCLDAAKLGQPKAREPEPEPRPARQPGVAYALADPERSSIADLCRPISALCPPSPERMAWKNGMAKATATEAPA